LNSQRGSLVGPTPIKIDLGLFRAGDSSLGEVVLGLARSVSSLVDGDGTVALFTLINDSLEVVEKSRGGAETVKIIDLTIVRGTEDVEDSLETTVVLHVFFSVENHGTDIFVVGKKTTGSIGNDETITVNLFEGNIDTSESKRAESEDTDKE
jgi:hypothetical protein